MEIAPIAGIRAASLVSTPRVVEAPSRPFEIDAAAEAGDDPERVGRESADRGLDEDVESTDESDDLAELPAETHGAQIDLVA